MIGKWKRLGVVSKQNCMEKIFYTLNIERSALFRNVNRYCECHTEVSKRTFANMKNGHHRLAAYSTANWNAILIPP